MEHRTWNTDPFNTIPCSIACPECVSEGFQIPNKQMILHGLTPVVSFVREQVGLAIRRTNELQELRGLTPGVLFTTKTPLAGCPVWTFEE
jgi:hypothetical protein